jgi:hypothetical protein
VGRRDPVPRTRGPPFLKQTHKKVDAELPAAAEPHRPPVRTFWHALYCPEERRLQSSFYLRDEAIPGRPDKVNIVRSEYREFRLPPTERGQPPVPEPTPRQVNEPQAGPVPAELDAAQQPVVDQLKRGGGAVRIQDGRVVVLVLDKAPDLSPLLPLLQKLPDLT